MQRAVALVVRNVSDHGGCNKDSQLISCQSINKEIWRGIRCFWTLIDMENVSLFQTCLRKELHA